ncbi:peptidoglycan-binding protein [Calothrix membranacea FACHB-236]|nr:peptidoglycan-binding protein [Calothrix membranacea FACHB-236]
MNTQFIRSKILRVSLFSALVLGVLAVSMTPARGQTSSTLTNIIADGRLIEYSSSTAPILVRGTVTPAVRDVQTFLKQQGFYNGSIDGIYGPNTYSAVVTFQRSRNLTADGRIGQNTWEALLDAYNRNTPVNSNNLSQYSPNTAPILKIGSQGQAVKDIQAFLKQQGYYTGAVDGIYGSATAASIEAFQQRYANLQNDGIVGRNTWSTILDTVS